MNYTDDQLKQALAKMLPEEICWSLDELNWIDIKTGFWSKVSGKVLDTELLEICHRVEKTLSREDRYRCILNLYEKAMSREHNDFDASWKQRTIALAKVKGIEI